VVVIDGVGVVCEWCVHIQYRGRLGLNKIIRGHWVGCDVEWTETTSGSRNSSKNTPKTPEKQA